MKRRGNQSPSWGGFLWRMTSLVLLAGYPHGSRRLRINNKQRYPLRLPLPGWFVQLIEQEGLQTLLEHRVPLREPAVEGNQGASIVAVLAVTKGKLACDGVLTPWSQQERLLWDYHEQRADLISVSIQAVWRLQTPAHVMSAKVVNRHGLARAGSSAVTAATHPLFVPATSVLLPESVVVNLDDAKCTFREVQLHVGLDPFDDGDGATSSAELPCTWLVEPVLQLVLRGLWTALLLAPLAPQTHMAMALLRHNLQWPDFASWARLEEVHQAYCKVPPRIGEAVVAPCDAYLKENDVLFLSDVLRQHSPTIIDSAQDAGEMRLKLQGILATLDAIAKSCQPQQPLRLLPRGTGVSELEAQRLIHALQLCYGLRNRDELKDSVDLMMKALLPPHHIEAVRQSLRRIPTAGTISKLQLRVDASLSLVWRKKLCDSKGPVLLVA